MTRILAIDQGTTSTRAILFDDSLSVIAYRMYGNQGLADTILGANPQLGGKASLQIGQKLKLPIR